MERFGHKSGRAMWFVKCLKETGLQCYSKNFDYIYTTFKSVITKAQEYDVSSKLRCYVFLNDESKFT